MIHLRIVKYGCNALDVLATLCGGWFGSLSLLHHVILYHSHTSVKGFHSSNLSTLRGDDPLKMAKNQPRKQPAEELQPEQPQDSGTQSGNPSRILENLDAELHQFKKEYE